MALEMPAYDSATIDQDLEYVATKLRISMDELSHYFTMPKKFSWDYRNQEKLFNVGARVLSTVGLESAIKR